MKIVRASLVEFLKNGYLGDIYPGLSQPGVIAALGWPKHIQHFHIDKHEERDGVVLAYNSLEVTCQSGVVFTIVIDVPLNAQSIDLPIQFAPEDLILSRSVTQEQFENYLRLQNLTYTSHFETQPFLLVAGHASVMFDTEFHLDSLFVS